MILQSLQPTPQVSIKSILTPVAPRASPSSKPISTKSFYRPKRLGGGGTSPSTMVDDDDDGGKGKKANISHTKPEVTEEYSFSDDGPVVTFHEGIYKDEKSPPIGKRSNDEKSHLNDSGVETGLDLSQQAVQVQKNELHDCVGRPSTNFSNDPLHELRLHDFCNVLTLLRESTLKVLEIFHQEKERLCLEGEILEASIAYMRHKIGSARDQLLKRGVVLEVDPDDLRLSMVQEGEEIPSASGDASDLIWNSVDKEPITPPTESLQLKGCSKCDDSGVRTSILRSLHWLSRKTLLDQREISMSSDINFRLTFNDGAFDGMPSRWKAREQERAKKIKQHEDDENQSKGSVTHAEKMENKKSNNEKAPELILIKEREISVLEKRASSLEQDTLSMRDEVSTLLKDLERAQSEFQQERTQLLSEIDRIELGNEKLDHVWLSERILLEEKKMSIEILASELKVAREELIQIQNERDRQKRITLERCLRNDGAGSDGNLKSENEKRYSRLYSTISALTLDSLDLVDILEQI